MRVAKVRLGARELERLRSGEPLIIRLPDARVEVTLSGEVARREKADDILSELQRVIGRSRAN